MNSVMSGFVFPYKAIDSIYPVVYTEKGFDFVQKTDI